MMRLSRLLLPVMFSVSLLPATMDAQALDSLTIRARYAETAGKILAAVHAGRAMERLSYLCDTFGPRLSGSSNLSQAIAWIETELKRDGLEQVRTEEVSVPHWVRGRESARLLEPRTQELPMSGLGGSVGTPPGGITADLLVVSDFDELTRRSAEARGKIVLYDVPWTDYGRNVQYRSQGAVQAARAGAVASLISSVASYSLQTPHTGMMRYVDSLPHIPHAAITVEDAAMLHRMFLRGQHVRLHLEMEAQTLPDTLSHNVIAEIRGADHPEEVVVFGGHIDSWDVGQGAQDDAGGCIATWEALRVIRELGLRPRRTLRLVLWTNEENGLRGATGYASRHQDEIPGHVLAMEMDGGVFRPTGFAISGSDSVIAAVRAIGSLLAPIGADTVTVGGGGADISPLTHLGVPGMSPRVDNAHYFWFHHSPADTVSAIDSDNLDACIRAIAVMLYAVADLPIALPRAHAAVH